VTFHLWRKQRYLSFLDIPHTRERLAFSLFLPLIGSALHVMLA
jgi:hypothetical protein